MAKVNGIRAATASAPVPDIESRVTRSLSYFQSYLKDRRQTFAVNRNVSTTYRVNRSVPQGSALGPAELITYTESVTSVFGRHSINHHLFADDKQA